MSRTAALLKKCGGADLVLKVDPTDGPEVHRSLELGTAGDGHLEALERSLGRLELRSGLQHGGVADDP